MAHQYIQVPPDSTGKQVFNRARVEINYENGTIDFQVGDVVTGATSSVFGEVIKVTGTTLTGTLDITLDSYSSVAFTGSENLQVGGVTNATFVGGSQTTYYVPVTTIAGGIDSSRAAAVDSKNSLQVGFGQHELDAFGRLDTADATVIADYKFDYGSHSTNSLLIAEETNGTATATFVSAGHYVDMEVDNGSGDEIIRTSNIYHPFVTAQAQRCVLTVWHGDSGKTNNRRRWGYFDEFNGAFFELDGTTLKTVVRSNATGTVVDTEHEQTNWSDDTMDGDADAENPSGLSLDLTKIQNYFIDMGHAGDSIRFGIHNNNKKLLFDHHYQGNQNAYPICGDFQLPVRWEITNTGATAGTSNLYTVEASVITEGRFEPTLYPFAQDSGLKTLTTSASWTPLFSGRMNQRFGSNQPNRRQTIPKTVSVYNNGSLPIAIRMTLNSTLTGATWADFIPGSATIQDLTATSMSEDGLQTGYFTVAPNSEKDYTFPFDLNTPSGKLFNYADPNQDPFHMTISAKLLDGTTGTNTVIAYMNWLEF